MATKGPIPKRTEERRRTNEPEGISSKLGNAAMVIAEVDLDPAIPEPKDDWEAQTQALYNSLRRSPGVVFMYAGDWQAAWMLCEQLDRELKPQFVGFEDVWNRDADAMEHRARFVRRPMSGSSLAALHKILSELGVTEGGRRRMLFEAPPLDKRPDMSDLDGDDGIVTDIKEARTARLVLAPTEES